MDKNTVIGFVLIAILFVVYSMYNSNQMEQQKAQERQTRDTIEVTRYNPPTSTIETTDEAKEEPSNSAIVTITKDSIENLNNQKQELGPFYQSITGTEKFYTIENENLKIVLSSKGGTIYSVEVKGYRTWDSLPLILFEGNDNQENLQFFIKNNRVVNSNELYFEPSTVTDSKISLRVSIGQDKYIEQSYSLSPESYLVGYDIKMVGLNDVIASNNNFINLHWKRELRKLEKSKDGENRYTGLHYKYTDDEASNLSETGNDEASLSTSVKWVSLKQQFFNSTLINPEGFKSGTVKSNMDEESSHLKTMEVSLILPYNSQEDQQYKLQYYFGPNHYQTLKKLNVGLQEITSITGFMSWVSFITKGVIIPLFNFLNQYISSYGIIILILTLIIKMVLFPLTYKSYKSTAMMKVLKPELDALKEKHKDDQQKFASEQWKLFQSAGVSPMGGCLPMVLQMPILIAMYYFFPTSIELRQEAFLWAADLSTYDSIWDLPFNVPFYGDHVSLFTLLMTVSSILYAVTNPQMSSGPASMKYMPYVFPIMLLGVFNSFPAALTYYYFLANIISYLQQFIIKKFIIDDKALHKKIQENKKKPKKKGGFQSRLEELSKKQREIQKQRGKKK